MSYEAAEKLLSSRTISKSAVGKLPIKTLSRWCDMQGIAISPTGKRSGSAIKRDYVEAILIFVRHQFWQIDMGRRIHTCREARQ